MPSYVAYNSAAATTYGVSSVAGLVPAGAVDIPDFDAIAQKDAATLTDKERKQNNRQSWRRGEMHLPPATPPSTRLIQLPSGAVLGGSMGTSTPFHLTNKEMQHSKRISGGFLQPGPDLNQFTIGIVAQVLDSNPEEAATPSSKQTAVRASSRKGTNPQGNVEDRAAEVHCCSSYGNQVSSSPQDADTSPFDTREFPLLSAVARTLSGTGPALLGPLPLGHNSHHGSGPCVDRSANGNYEWQWRRFSDREYEDPASTDYRKNRPKRLGKRRNDLAAYDTSSSRNAAFTISEDDMVTFEAHDLARSTSRLTYPSNPEYKSPENAQLVTDIPNDESCVRSPTTQTDPDDYVSKRKSALLRSIDFTDNATRSSPPRRRVDALDELIDF